MKAKKHKNMKNQDDFLEFYSHIQDIFEHADVQALRLYDHHLGTNRLQHSLHVSYMSFRFAKRLNMDQVSIARAGLLHDLFYYEGHRNESEFKGRHSTIHPKIALQNAMDVTNVNHIMEDAILHHMWPMSLKRPKTKEGWLLQAVDKFCACKEVKSHGVACIKDNKATKKMRNAISYITK